MSPTIGTFCFCLNLVHGKFVLYLSNEDNSDGTNEIGESPNKLVYDVDCTLGLHSCCDSFQPVKEALNNFNWHLFHLISEIKKSRYNIIICLQTKGKLKESCSSGFRLTHSYNMFGKNINFSLGSVFLATVCLSLIWRPTWGIFIS